MVILLLSFLNNTNKPLGFIITVPIWDNYTQLKIAKRCNIYNITEIHKSKTETIKYKCADLIKSSKYLYKEYTFCKKDFPYYSFAQNRIINASNTYIFIVKNDLLQFDTNLFESILHNNKLHYIR